MIETEDLARMEDVSAACDGGIAVSSGYESRAECGDGGIAVAGGDWSYAECGDHAFAVSVGIGGEVKGGTGSALALGYWDQASQCNRIAVANVGEDGILSDTWYRVDSNGNFHVPARAAE